jgi:hypothetical protein
MDIACRIALYPVKCLFQPVIRVRIEKKVERDDDETLTAFELARFTFVRDNFLSLSGFLVF